MTTETLKTKRDTLIVELKTVDQQIIDFDDFNDKAKKKRKPEIDAVNARKVEINDELIQLDLDIAAEIEAEKQAKINTNLESYVSNYLNEQGLSVSNWQDFTKAYDSVTKFFTKSKIKFTALSDEVLQDESASNADTISSWFSGLTFQQKASDETVFNTTNELTGLRLKTGNVKSALIECLQNQPTLIDELKPEVAQKIIKFLISRTKVKSTGSRGSRANSMKSKVDAYLNEIGEGNHKFSDYENWYMSEVGDAKTTPLAQLTMCCRADKNGKFEMSKTGDIISLVLR